MNESTNINVGAGRLYFRPKDQAGERYLGETPGFQISVTSETLDVLSSDGPIAEKIESVTRSIDRTATITCQNVSAENLAMWMLGNVTSVTQTANEVADEEALLKAGEWYQLGGGVGVRDVSKAKVSGAINKKDTYVDLTLDEHYKLDAKRGRVQILVDPFDATDPFKFTYTPTAGKYAQVETSDDKSFEGALRFVADNTTGTNRVMHAPNVVITPEGSVEFKSRDNPIQFTFNVDFLKEGSDEALYFTNQEAG